MDRRSLRFLGGAVVQLMNLAALVTATEATTRLPVSVQLIGMWKLKGKLEPAGRRGRSPLYRFGDLVALERDMRLAAAAANNHRARQLIAA